MNNMSKEKQLYEILRSIQSGEIGTDLAHVKILRLFDVAQSLPSDETLIGEARELHLKLSQMIRKLGQSYPKKHGSWIILKVSNGRFFELDSWNHSIKMKQGSGEYDYWNGFNGNTIIYFGLFWGNFETKVAPQVYQSAISCITN